MLAALLNIHQRPPQFVRDVSVDLIENHFVETEDRVHGRPQLVAHVCEEIRFVPAGRRELTALVFELGKRALERHTPFLELNRPLSNAIFECPVQLPQLGKGALFVVHAASQRFCHVVERGGKRADLILRPHGDLLVQLAGRNHLRLLSQLLDGIRDAEREPIENGSTHDEKHGGDPTPESCETTHLRLDARERQPDGRSPDDFLACQLPFGSGLDSEDDLFGRLAALGHNRRHKLQEALAAMLHLTCRRPITLRDDVSGRRHGHFGLASTSKDPSVPTVDEHVAHVRGPERAAYGRFQALRVFAEDPQLARESEARGQLSAALLELSGHQSPMLADVHPSLEDEKGHDDRNNRPEDTRPEAREAPKPDASPRRRHSMRLVARARIAFGISSPSCCAVLRLTVRYTIRALVYGTSATARPRSIAWASSPACRPISSPLAKDIAKRAPICA